jgi:hypothetical protein
MDQTGLAGESPDGCRRAVDDLPAANFKGPPKKRAGQ